MKIYFLLNMGIFQPAMLVYQRVDFFGETQECLNQTTKRPSSKIRCRCTASNKSPPPTFRYGNLDWRRRIFFRFRPWQMDERYIFHYFPTLKTHKKSSIHVGINMSVTLMVWEVKPLKHDCTGILIEKSQLLFDRKDLKETQFHPNRCHWNDKLQ